MAILVAYLMRCPFHNYIMGLVGTFFSSPSFNFHVFLISYVYPFLRFSHHLVVRRQESQYIYCR